MVDQLDEYGLPLWPAAERNKQPIVELLTDLLKEEGLVDQAGERRADQGPLLLLEIASATGQHSEHFARALPSVMLQPSDVDPQHLETLQARHQKLGLPNLLGPLRIDATESAWPIERADLVYNANMIHIAPWEATVGLFRGAAGLLVSGSLLLTYGPYKMDGEATAESNLRFDASLRERNPSWGVRELQEIRGVAEDAGFRLDGVTAMPANNHLLRWRRA